MFTLTQMPTSRSLPVLDVVGRETTTPVEWREHRVIGSGAPDFTTAPAQPRRGTHTLLCRTRTAGEAVAQLLRGPGPFTLSDVVAGSSPSSTPPSRFVVTGAVRVRYEGASTCLVDVEYTEVAA